MKKLICKIFGHRTKSELIAGILIKHCSRCGKVLRDYFIPRIKQDKYGAITFYRAKEVKYND